MRRTALAASLASLALAGLLVLVTWLALESQEVAILETRSANDDRRSTRVWVARRDGSFWIEAATPDRAWYVELLRDPRVRLELGGRSIEAQAIPMSGEAGHEQIRRLLRDGGADAWVGLLQDTSRSIAVRLAEEP